MLTHKERKMEQRRKESRLTLWSKYTQTLKTMTWLLNWNFLIIRATTAAASIATIGHIWWKGSRHLCDEVRELTPSSLIELHLIMAVLPTETELWMHGTLADVTFVSPFFSIPHVDHTNAAPITHTTAQLERECELMSRAGQVNEGWCWSAEDWN